jgi:hypothetical protein
MYISMLKCIYVPIPSVSSSKKCWNQICTIMSKGLLGYLATAAKQAFLRMSRRCIKNHAMFHKMEAKRFIANFVRIIFLLFFVFRVALDKKKTFFFLHFKNDAPLRNMRKYNLTLQRNLHNKYIRVSQTTNAHDNDRDHDHILYKR